MKDVLFPKEQIKAIKVKFVTAKNVAKTTKKVEPKSVKTQQSSAPAAPPKPKAKPKPKPKPKPNTPTIVQKKPEPKKEPKVEQVKKPEPKKPEPPKKQEPKVADVPRPPKLDKTKNKKNVVKDTEPQKEKTPAPDDFLKALSFIEELESEENAMFEGEETTAPTTLNHSDQADIALLKKHIERNWYKTPGTVGEKPVHFRLKLNRDGTLAEIQLIQSSGKRSFDKSLERAIRKSVPLPISAEKYDLFKEIDLHWAS